MDGKLYFAYGSNMNLMRLQDRVGDVDSIGVGVAHNIGFVYDKPDLNMSQVYANVHPQYGERTFGVLFTLTEYQFGLLDCWEPGYRRVRIEVNTSSKLVVANTYTFEDYEAISMAVALGLKPTQKYINHILLGAGNYNLPADYVHQKINVL